MKCACETDPDGSIRSLCAAHENKAAALYGDADLIRQLQRDAGRKGRLIQTLHELVAQEIGRSVLPPPERVAGEPPRVHVVKSVNPYFGKYALDIETCPSYEGCDRAALITWRGCDPRHRYSDQLNCSGKGCVELCECQRSGPNSQQAQIGGLPIFSVVVNDTLHDFWSI